LCKHHHIRLDRLPTASASAVTVGDGSVPRYDATAEPGLARDLEERADEEFWVIVEKLCLLADHLAGAVRAHFTGLPAADRPTLTNKEISAWACATVARPYYREPALPAADYLLAERNAYEEQAVARAARTRGLPTATEFANQYGPVYDKLWGQRREAALAVLSPVDLGLGELPGPPMCAAVNGWRVGTDRSVQHRYGLYFRSRWDRDPDATARVAGLDPGKHLSVRLRTAEPDAVCRGELERACSPIGLRSSRHHVFMSSFVTAVRLADMQAAFDARKGSGRRPPPSRQLATWAAAAHRLPEIADTALERAVTSFAEYWAARHQVAEQLAETRRLANWTGEVERGTARRLWGRLHQREVVWEAPVVRSEAASLVKKMFQVHLLELILPPDEKPEEEPTGDPAPNDPRLWRSHELMKERGDPSELLGRLVADGENWEQWYRAIVEPDADRCLPPAVFRDWALSHLVDPNETAEDR